MASDKKKDRVRLGSGFIEDVPEHGYAHECKPPSTDESLGYPDGTIWRCAVCDLRYFLVWFGEGEVRSARWEFRAEYGY